MLLKDCSDVHVRWKTFWHVTHFANVRSIQSLGLLPARSRRSAKRVWLADLALIPWAMRHVCASQGWDLTETALIRVCLPTDLPVRHRVGVYYYNEVIPPKHIGAATLACKYWNKWPRTPQAS
jgi:hypothetical protein